MTEIEDYHRRLIEAADKAIDDIRNMSDDDLLLSLEECDGCIAYAFNPHLDQNKHIKGE